MRLLHTRLAVVSCGTLWIAGSVLTVSQATGAAPDPIDRLIGQLGSDDFEVREAASKALKGVGEPALPALREATASADAEIGRRARELVEAIERPLVERARAMLAERGATIYPDHDHPDLMRIDGLGDKTTDQDLAQLKYFKDVGYLTIGSEEATDAGLAVLGDLHKLKELNIYCPKMTGAGLVHIKDLHNLTTLGLGSHRMTDVGLVYLKNLRRLEHLSLGGDEITNDTEVRTAAAPSPPAGRS